MLNYLLTLKKIVPCVQRARRNYNALLYCFLPSSYARYYATPYSTLEPSKVLVSCSHLFVSQARLDENQQQMEQDVSEMVNRIRGEGVERIVKLKKKRGCTKENDGLVLTRLKVQQVDMFKHCGNRRENAHQRSMLERHSYPFVRRVTSTS